MLAWHFQVSDRVKQPADEGLLDSAAGENSDRPRGLPVAGIGIEPARMQERGSDQGAFHRARRVRFDAEGADGPQKSLTIPGHMTIYGYWLALHLTSSKLPGSPLCHKWPQSPKLRWIFLWTDSCA